MKYTYSNLVYTKLYGDSDYKGILTLQIPAFFVQKEEKMFNLEVDERTLIHLIKHTKWTDIGAIKYHTPQCKEVLKNKIDQYYKNLNYLVASK